MISRICSLLKMKQPVHTTRGYLFASGITVPTDGTDGYLPGCFFQHTDGATGTVLYVNEGSITSCDFNAIAALTATQEALLGAVAGTITASKAVIVDANKDVGDFRNLDAVNLDAGVSGTAGTVDVFPTTASKGKNSHAAADNDGDTTNTFTNKAQAGARTFYTEDPEVGDAIYKMNSLFSRYRLEWTAGAKGKPGVNADVVPTSADDGNDGMTKAEFATILNTDKEFEILGTNASSDDVTYHAEGGILFTTDGADGDGIILLPHLDTGLSPWTQTTWGTDQKTRWECKIKTGASIGNCIIWAGLKLTNTDVAATDDDQAYFRYENGVNDGEFQAISSIGGVDDSHDTGVAVAINTEYHLVIDIQSDRTAKFYINGVLVETSAALTDAIDLIPYIAVEADGAAEAKTLIVRGQAIERDFA